MIRWSDRYHPVYFALEVFIRLLAQPTITIFTDSRSTVILKPVICLKAGTTVRAAVLVKSSVNNSSEQADSRMTHTGVQPQRRCMRACVLIEVMESNVNNNRP